jgi:hypothetical protein
MQEFKFTTGEEFMQAVREYDVFQAVADFKEWKPTAKCKICGGDFKKMRRTQVLCMSGDCQRQAQNARSLKCWNTNKDKYRPKKV